MLCCQLLGYLSDLLILPVHFDGPVLLTQQNSLMSFFMNPSFGSFTGALTPV